MEILPQDERWIVTTILLIQRSKQQKLLAFLTNFIMMVSMMAMLLDAQSLKLSMMKRTPWAAHPFHCVPPQAAAASRSNAPFADNTTRTGALFLDSVEGDLSHDRKQ